MGHSCPAPLSAAGCYKLPLVNASHPWIFPHGPNQPLEEKLLPGLFDLALELVTIYFFFFETRSRSVIQAVLKLWSRRLHNERKHSNPLTSASQKPGLQVCTTMPSTLMFFKGLYFVLANHCLFNHVNADKFTKLTLLKSLWFQSSPCKVNANFLTDILHTP